MMIGLDTNVLVRFLTADDPTQSALANKLVGSLTEEQPGFVSLVTVVETCWVLRQSYRYHVSDVNRVIAELLDTAELVVDQADLVRAALTVATETGRELPDALIAERCTTAGCLTTYTFDKQASSLPGMRLLVAPAT